MTDKPKCGYAIVITQRRRRGTVVKETVVHCENTGLYADGHCFKHSASQGPVTVRLRKAMHERRPGHYPDPRTPIAKLRLLGRVNVLDTMSAREYITLKKLADVLVDL